MYRCVLCFVRFVLYALRYGVMNDQMNDKYNTPVGTWSQDQTSQPCHNGLARSPIIFRFLPRCIKCKVV